MATSPAEPWGPVSALLSEVGRAAGFGGRLIGRTFRSRSREGFVDLGPGREEHDQDTAPKAAERPDLVVCASWQSRPGLLNARPELTLEEIDGLYPRLVPALASHEGIGFVLVRSAGRGALVLGPSGRRYLDEDQVEGDDPLVPFGSGAADDLRRLDAMPSVGDLVLNSRLDPGTDEVAAFEELVGSHGGPGGWQTEAFLLYPGAWEPPAAPIVGAPAAHRQLVAWLLAAGMRTRADGTAAEKEPQEAFEPVRST